MNIHAKCDGYLSARRFAKRVHSTVHNIEVDHWKPLCALLFASPKHFLKQIM
jgi:hypothetical protein